MAKSTHKVEVVPVVLQKHPNADSLSVVDVYGYTVCVRTQDWKDKSLGAYIPPDSIVPDTPEFAFLGDHKRIRVKRLRGVMSQGLLIPAPPGAKPGDDVAELLGVTHYNPPLPKNSGGEAEAPPPVLHFHYDVETWYRYKEIFRKGEEVVATEKIHGASARYVFTEGRFWCGSRTEWKIENEKNLWWKAAKASPWLQEFCEKHPDIMVYGEVFGSVQNLKYGTQPGEVRFLAFDLLRKGQWVSFDKAREIGSILQWTPLIYRGPYDAEKVFALADGNTTIAGADHIREGIVVKPTQERTSLETGRVQLKIVSNQYLERA